MKLVKRIDIHAHTISDKGILRANGETFATPEELFEMYEVLGIEKSVLLPIVSLDGGTDGNTNREILSLVRKYPDRFAWFCNIDPRQGKNSEETDFDSMLRYFKSQGAAGLGEIAASLPMDDPRVDALFAACERQQMPVLLHIGRLVKDYGLADGLGLPRLERALQKFPKLIIIGHSQKFWAEISGDVDESNRGGYPKGPVVPGGRVVELMRRYPNLYADLSAGSGANAMTRDPEFSYTFLEEFQDRLFFGTDIGSPKDIDRALAQLAPFLDRSVTEGRISQQAYEKVCRGNILRLLKGELHV